MSKSKEMMDLIKEISKEYLDDMRRAADGKEKTFDELIDEIIKIDTAKLKLDFIFMNSMDDYLCLTSMAYYHNIRGVLNDTGKNLTDSIPLFQETEGFDAIKGLESAMRIIDNTRLTMENLLESDNRKV